MSGVRNGQLLGRSQQCLYLLSRIVYVDEVRVDNKQNICVRYHLISYRHKCQSKQCLVP